MCECCGGKDRPHGHLHGIGLDPHDHDHQHGHDHDHGPVITVIEGAPGAKAKA